MRIPKGQKLWVTIRDEKRRVKLAITSDPARSNYILYKVYGSEAKQIKKASSPLIFQKITGVRI